MTAGGLGSFANDLGLYTSKIKLWIYNQGTCMTIIICLVEREENGQAVRVAYGISEAYRRRLGKRHCRAAGLSIGKCLTVCRVLISTNLQP